jgi:uncharacterized membrane protein YfcA
VDFFHTTSQSDLGVFALGLVIAGAVSGLAAGVLGVGGGIVIVPVLYHVMAAMGIGGEVRMHVAIATSLAAMVPAALAKAQNPKAPIDWARARTEAVPVLIGVAFGSACGALMTGGALAIVFAVAAITVVVQLAFGDVLRLRVPAGVLFVPATAALGSALTGIAADTIRRVISGETGAEQKRATASIVVVLAAASAALAYAISGWGKPDLPPDSLGYVNLLGFALVAPVLLATEPVGAAAAHMMDLRRLRLVFAGLIVITTARMLWDALT